ncbi:MAG TPA: PAS domain S-box protein [Crinalium sp.]
MKILVVEDDPTVAQILRLLLSRHNYAVDVATDGEAGLQMTEAFVYDLIVLDVLLPKLDGISLCQQLRTKGFQSPILLLTGQGGGHQKAIALNAGADDYVVKPFDTEELIARVQALLRRGGPTSQPILTFGQLSVDPSPCKVTYGTHLLAVTPKEYAILELLLRNPQKALSAQAILDHVWNSIESPGEEAVRVHIKELRHKLLAAGAPKDLIKTIHRVGYRLNPLYSSSLVSQAEDQLTAPQIAELKAVNEELRATLETLQAVQEELRRQNEELIDAQRHIEVERQRYQDLFEMAPDGYLVTDLEGSIQEANRAAFDLLTVEPRYLIGKPLTTFIAKTARHNFRIQLTQLNFGQNWEVNLQPKRGEAFPVMAAVTLIKNLQNETVGLRWLLRDIRPRKQMEQQLQAAYDVMEIRVAERTAELVTTNRALQQQQYRYATLTQAAPVGIFWFDADGQCTYVNERWSEMTGRPKETAMGMGWLQTLHPDDQKTTVLGWNQWAETWQPGVPYQSEVRTIRPDGSMIWLYVLVLPEVDANAVLVGYVGSLTNITQRKQAENELRQREEFLRSIYDGADQAVFVIDVNEDQDFHYLGFNYIAEQFSRSSAQNLLGKTPEEAYGDAIGARFRQNYSRCLTAGTSISYEEYIVFDNHILWALTTLSPLRNEKGEIYRLVGTAIDITDRKRLEAERQQAEAAIQKSEEQLRLALDLTYIGSWEWHISTGAITWNDHHYRLLGYQPGEVEASYQFWRSHLHPDDVTEVEQKLMHALHYRTDYNAEFRVMLRDGSIRWELSKGRGLYDELEQPTRMIGVSFDITDRKQAEISLQQQLLREKLIADISQDIRRSLNLENVLSRTVERVRELLETDRVIIFRFRPDWQGDVIMESVGSEWTSILATTIFDPCFRDRYVEPYRQGRVVTLCDINEEDLEPCYVELLRPFQVRANLAVPILQGENLWGLLIVHHCSAPRQWQASEIDLLRQLATQVGIAIHQSELYEQTQHELLERERMQIVLEASEERFRTLSASAPIGICQTNADGICLYVNERWQEMSGLSFENSLGNGWLQAIHPDDHAMIFAAWEAYGQGGSDRLPEFRLLTPTGIIRWISARVATMRSATGEVIGYVSTDEDITERKQAEQALRESEERLHTILDNSPAIMYLLDPQNRYLLLNRSYTERIGKMPEEVIGKSIYDVWPTEIADGFNAKNKQVLATGQRLQFEETVPHGTDLHTYITAKFPLCDATGAVYAICGISTDITEKKHLEAQAYRAQRMESLGTLASGIAHDLNNCLTPILAIAQLLRLKQPDLDEASREMLKVLEDSAKRGANMVKQILTFAKGTNGDRVSLQVASLLQDVVNVIQQTFPKSIAIRQNISDQPLGPVSADPTHLHQVLLNLCVNARDAMPNGGTLTLAAKNFYVDELFAQMNLDAKAGHYVVMIVTDTGTGISAEVRDRIFDPFFTTKALGQGIGLGLSTALGIVKSYGGFMQVFSQVGQGSQFKVYLPMMEGTTPESAQAEALLYGNGELVLIVDDDLAVQRTNQSLLESHHYTTLIASDGLEAIDLYTQHQQSIKVVLIDMMMPNMDGRATIRALHDINPAVKIIAISGLSANQDAALTAGANTFLPKPYTLEDLLRRLHKLIKM